MAVDLFRSYLRIYNPVASIVIAVFVIRAVWGHPEWAVAVFVGGNRLVQNISIYEPLGVGLAHQLPMSYLVAAVLVGHVFHVWFQGRHKPPRGQWSLWKDSSTLSLVLLLAVQLVDTAVRPPRGGKFELRADFIQMLLTFFPFFATIAVIRSQASLRKLGRAVFVCILIREILVLWSILAALGRGLELEQVRAQAVFGLDIMYIDAADALFWGGAYFLLAADSHSRWLGLFLALVAIAHAILTQGRGIWLTMVVGACVFGVRAWAWRHGVSQFLPGAQRSLRKRVDLWVAVSCFAAIGMVCVTVWEPTSVPVKRVIRVITDRLADSSGDDPTSGRDLLWAQSLQSFQSSPIVGVGKGRATLPGLGIIDGRRVWVSRSPHNLYLGTLAEYGIVGFVPLAIFVMRLLSGLRRPERWPEVDLSVMAIVSQALIVGLLVRAAVGGADLMYSYAALPLAVSLAIKDTPPVPQGDIGVQQYREKRWVTRSSLS